MSDGGRFPEMVDLRHEEAEAWKNPDTLEKSFHDYLVHTLKAIHSIRYDSSAFNKAIDCLVKSVNGKEGGKVITTGMGKAGYVAHKFSASLSSLGIPAAYLHPGEAAHGDLGIITPHDTLFAFSTSGKTREIIETIQFARHLNVGAVVAITSHPDSQIKTMSDVVINMGEIEEYGALHLAPTTSVVIMLVIADFLAVIASEIRGFTKEDFAKRHHGGYLGQKSRGELTNGTNK